MQRLKLTAFNFVCLLIISYFSVITCRFLISSSPVYDNDYQTFRVSLAKPSSIYQEHQYARVTSITIKGTKATLKTLPNMIAINMNTPPMNLFIKEMMSIGTLSTNAIAWTVLSLFGAALSVLVLLQLFSDKKIYTYFFPLLLLLYLSWPSLSNLKLGQVSYFILPLLSIAFVLHERKHWLLMTVVLALLASLKVFFLIFILMFVAKRQWQLLALFFATFLFFFFLPLLYFPWSVYHDFFLLTQNKAIFIQHASFAMNGSLLGVLTHIIDAFHLHLTVSQVSTYIALVLSYLIALWLIVDLRIISKLPEYSDALRFSFLILLALACSPLAWDYYFLFLLIPLVLIFRIAMRYRLPSVFFVFFIVAIFFPYLAWMYSKNHLLTNIQYLSVFIGLLCWFFCLCCVVRAVRLKMQAVDGQITFIYAVLSVHVLVNVILLFLNFGMPYFFDITQRIYKAHTMPAITINRKK